MVWVWNIVESGANHHKQTSVNTRLFVFGFFNIFIILTDLHSVRQVLKSLVLCVDFVDHCLSFCPFSFGHCIVCSSSIYGVWIPLWYLHIVSVLVLCVCFVDRCLSFCPFSFGHCVVCSSSIYGVWIPLWYLHIVSVLVWCVGFVDRCLSFCPFSFGHCVVCSSSIYGFWLPLWYFQPLRNRKPV
jgi:hypothetical protein